jgi:membrane protease YdiL (CAAX protease family)
MNTVYATREVENTRQEQLRELLVFLFLIVPSMGLSFFVVRLGNLSFRLTATSTILRDLALVSLILYFLRRNDEPQARVGWNFAHAWQDAGLGILLYLPMLLGIGVVEQILRSAGFTSPATQLPHALTAKDPAEFVLAGVLVVVVAVAEEIIFRGYLILRLKAVTGSDLWAAILSSIIFSLGHGYEGTAGVIAVGCMGLFFAVVYLSRRSLVAPIVMHFLQDFIGIVVVPLLKHA